MNFLLLGSNYFQNPLKQLGHRVVWAASDSEADIVLPSGDPHVGRLATSIGFRPDAVVLTDNLGGRVFPDGLESLAGLKVWYAVDSPINHFWQRHMAHLFDLVLVDQKPMAEKLAALAPGRVHWLPVAVDTMVYTGPPQPKRYDIAFVGVISDRVRPKRSNILNRLKSKYHVVTAGGRESGWVPPPEAAALYRQARIVINENLFPGVTTRMFEAMAAGSLLLTEAGDDGLTDLFEPGRHLAVYRHDDLTGQADFLLSHDTIRESIAASGASEVLKKHDLVNRAEHLTELVRETMPAARRRSAAEHLGKAMLEAGLRWPAQHGTQRILKAEKMILSAGCSGDLDTESLYLLGCTAGMKQNWSGAAARLHAAADRAHIKARMALVYVADRAASPKSPASLFREAAKCAGFGLPAHLPGLYTAGHHYLAGRILAASGHDMTPGFSRYALDITLWDALDHFRQTIETDPAHVGALTAIGDILAGRGAFAEAFTFFDRASRLSPRSGELREKRLEAEIKGYVSSGGKERNAA